MYVPPDFRIDEVCETISLINEYPFGLLIGADSEQMHLSHIPMHVERESPLVLSGHLARANKHWRRIEGRRVTVVFSGPHAYVSPRWYENHTRNVPTWNYAVAHCTGIGTLTSDEEKSVILEQMIADMEGKTPGAWSLDDLEKDYRDALMRNIVCFRIAVDSVQAKFKMSQNRSAEDFGGVLKALRSSARQSDNAVADMMSAMRASVQPCPTDSILGNVES